MKTFTLFLCLPAIACGAVKFEEGSFEFPNARDGKTIVFDYRVPTGEDGSPIVTARQIIFYAPCFGETKHFNDPKLVRYSSEFGFTLLTMRLQSNSADIGVRERYYIFPEAGFHQPIFNAVDNLQKKFALPKEKILLLGISSGGSMAELLAIHNPEKVRAAAITGGRFFDVPPENFSVPILVLNTYGCPNEKDTRQLAEAWPKTARPSLFTAQTQPIYEDKGKRNFHHTPSYEAFELMAEFLRSAVASPQERFQPSPAFERLWNNIPREMPENLKNNESAVLFPPAGRTPERVVLFFHDPSFYLSTTIADNLRYLAEHDAIAVSIPIEGDPVDAIPSLRRVINSTENNEEWKKFPLYIVGTGIGGQLAAVAAQNSTEGRIRRIVCINTNYTSVFPEISIAATRTERSVPLRILCDDTVVIPPDPGINVEFIRLRHAEPYLGKGINWFETLRRHTEN